MLWMNRSHAAVGSSEGKYTGNLGAWMPLSKRYINAVTLSTGFDVWRRLISVSSLEKVAEFSWMAPFIRKARSWLSWTSGSMSSNGMSESAGKVRPRIVASELMWLPSLVLLPIYM